MTTNTATLELLKLQRRLEREHHARLEAELIAERSLRELYAQTQQLQLLEAIAVAANQASSFTEVLQYTVTKVCEYSNLPVGHAYLTDHHNSTMIWHSQRPDLMTAFSQQTTNIRTNQDLGLLDQVIASGRAVWIEPLSWDNTFLRTWAEQHVSLNAAFAFPVVIGDRVTAVLTFFSYTAAPPSTTLLHLMAQIGLQLSRVIERQLAAEQLTYDAFHDSLTHLPNRALFLDRLKHALTRRQRNPHANFAVLFVDLDRFKIINDSLGHSAGDLLIKLIAERLLSTLRCEDTIAYSTDNTPSYSKDTLARLGGDEFTLLLEESHDPLDALRVADRIQAMLSAPFVLSGQKVYVTASIGVALSHEQSTADEIVRNADLAMYRAKSLGGARCEFFDSSMHALALNRLMIETDLRCALQEQLFILHYQPIVSLKTGVIVGVEALVRWQKTPTTLIYPNDFIPIAEDSGLIELMDMWVMQEACHSMRRWHLEFPQQQPFSVSINLSARLFAQPDLAAKILHILTSTGINPASVRLEITESMTMSHTERAIATMLQLKAMGLHLSIDDFGTGYSSLSYLHRFPADILKIDRAFVSRINDSHECFQIVRSIMSLARNLGMKVIAEGPETKAQVLQLQALDCDYGQGYFFSKPVEGQQIHQLLSQEFCYEL